MNADQKASQWSPSGEAECWCGTPHASTHARYHQPPWLCFWPSRSPALWIYASRCGDERDLSLRLSNSRHRQAHQPATYGNSTERAHTHTHTLSTSLINSSNTLYITSSTDFLCCLSSNIICCYCCTAATIFFSFLSFFLLSAIFLLRLLLLKGKTGNTKSIQVNEAQDKRTSNWSFQNFWRT